MLGAGEDELDQGQGEARGSVRWPLRLAHLVELLPGSDGPTGGGEQGGASQRELAGIDASVGRQVGGPDKAQVDLVDERLREAAVNDHADDLGPVLTVDGEPKRVADLAAIPVPCVARSDSS